MKRIVQIFATVSALLVLTSAGCDKSDTQTASLKVSETSFDEFAATGGTGSFTVTSSQPWTVSSPDWISVNPARGNASDHGIRVNFTVAENSADARKANLVVASGSESSNVAISQAANESPVVPSLSGKKFAVIGNSMVYYGGMVQKGDQGKADPGMFSKILKKHHGNDIVVYDFTFGDHSLSDFITVCKHDGSCLGTDHIAGPDLSKVDYVFISQSGSNHSTFYTDAASVYNRFKKANPDVKLFYINHIYTCYKGHQNILGNLKNLHDNLGVTIINCGQLAYDLYKGNVTVPGGTVKYPDHYTFTNHTDSDTHHPNPLMGYIMTQMAYCAVSGEPAEGEDYMSLVTTSLYAGGSVSYSSYYSKYYTTAASVPFTTVLTNKTEMAGIQQLIPQYINKY